MPLKIIKVKIKPKMIKIMPIQIFPRPFFCTRGFLTGSGGILGGGLIIFLGGGGGGGVF